MLSIRIFLYSYWQAEPQDVTQVGSHPRALQLRCGQREGLCCMSTAAVADLGQRNEVAVLRRVSCGRRFPLKKAPAMATENTKSPFEPLRPFRVQWLAKCEMLLRRSAMAEVAGAWCQLSPRAVCHDVRLLLYHCGCMYFIAIVAHCAVCPLHNAHSAHGTLHVLNTARQAPC